MAKSITAASADERSLTGRVMAWPERVKTFYNDVRSEMKKVTAPSFKDVQATTVVVVITVFLFGIYFWILDNDHGSGIDYLPVNLTIHSFEEERS